MEKQHQPETREESLGSFSSITMSSKQTRRRRATLINIHFSVDSVFHVCRKRGQLLSKTFFFSKWKKTLILHLLFFRLLIIMVAESRCYHCATISQSLGVCKKEDRETSAGLASSLFRPQNSFRFQISSCNWSLWVAKEIEIHTHI